MGISNDARDFLEAAQLVRPQKPDWFAPTFFLVCQSIELSLKAYLRGSGFSDAQLRKLGHDLDAGISAATAAGVDGYVSLSDQDRAAISAINPYYRFKDFQYSVTGFKSFPHPDVLLELAGRLWQGLRRFCEQHRDYHVGKPTAIA